LSSLLCADSQGVSVLVSRVEAPCRSTRARRPQVVAKLKAQSQKNVRAMDYDAGRNLLVTAGFDRSVSLFLERAPAEQIT